MNWLVGAALILVLSLIFDLGLLAYAMYALLSVLFVSRYLASQWAESLTADRECNRLTADVGDSVAVIVNIENQGKLPVPWCLVEDLLPRRALIHTPPNLAVEGSRLQLSMLRAGAKQSLLYQLTCNRRGYYQLGPLVLETGDLFGLHRRYRVATKPHFLLVLPQVIPLEGYDVSSKRPIGEVKMTYRLFEDPTRIAGVRRYEQGDPLSRVNWRATARTGQLHSKVYEPSTVAGATILLEYHNASHSRQHEPMRSELAVTAAASIANAVYEMGQQIGLITNGRDAADRIRQEGWDHDIRTRDAARNAASMRDASDRLQPVVVETKRGPEQLMQIMESLARVELTDGLTLSQLVGETADRLPRDATIIAILPQVTTESAITLGSLRRQGYAVTAILNMYDEYDFAQAAGPLISQGIDVQHLKDEMSIVSVCRKFVLR
ncbi:MAG: DUF58 domain-containing protein [Planctomycetaceae bacterium]|nr:DUF58 domain-containing protein [Planctomycetaceae bacterium]MCB9938390.1 DUF58 domain-containing protein [Planctomycetaceae bacterium]